MKAIIPLQQDSPGGPFVQFDEDQFTICAENEKTVLIEFYDAPDQIDWVEPFTLLYCQKQHDSSVIKVIREATDQERKKFRVPLWIQSEEIPFCCDEPMFFIGQIDDDDICTEVPDGAKMWWHDSASFYIFTCSKCLECKVVGQQF